MAISVPTSEPLQLRVGDTWAWRREDLSDYPAGAGWALTYYFRNAGAHFDIAASADGDAFAVSVAKATTAAYAAGRYDWLAVVDDGSARHQVAEGAVDLLPDFAVAANLDGRSFARQMLAAVEAEILKRGSSGQIDVIEAALGDRNLKRDAAGLIALRSQLIAEVKREEAAGQGGGRNRLLVRFER